MLTLKAMCSKAGTFSTTDIGYLVGSLDKEFQTDTFIPLTVNGENGIKMFTLLPASLVEDGTLDVSEIEQNLFYASEDGNFPMTLSLDTVELSITPAEGKSQNAREAKASAIVSICLEHGIDEDTAYDIAQEILGLVF